MAWTLRPDGRRLAGGGNASMAGVFACPECGATVTLGKLPGRRVRCARCSTLLEVPFLPRMATRGRDRRRMRLLRLGAAVAALVLLLAFGTAWLGSRVGARRQAALQQRLAAAEAAEHAGRLEAAAAEIDVALALARSYALKHPDGLETRRAGLLIRDIQRRLEAAARLDPAEAVAACEALRDRVDAHPELNAIRGSVVAALSAASARQAHVLIEKAETELRAEHRMECLAHATAARVLADQADSNELRAAADALAVRIAARVGVVAEPVTGQYGFGTAADYDAGLRGTLLAGMVRLGYTPAPENSIWSALWEKTAPYRLTTRIDEQLVPYFSSANQGTHIAAHFRLTRGGQEIWTGTIMGRTRTPPPDMPSYEASVVAVATKPNANAGRRLFEDALAVLLSKAPNLGRSLPPPGP